jgi:hypothetical protein
VTDTILTVRLMVEVASQAEAEDQLRQVTPRVEGCGAVTDAKIEQYWKIPEYWEIALYVRPAGSPVGAYACVVHMASSGWTTGGSDDDPWAVWNAHRGGVLLTDRVRWAEVHLWRRDGDS